MIKHDWEIFFRNRGMEDWANRAKKLSSKIFMATEWLEKHTNLKEILKSRNIN